MNEILRQKRDEEHRQWVTAEAEKLDDELSMAAYMGVDLPKITSLKAMRGIAKEGWEFERQRAEQHRRDLDFLGACRGVRSGRLFPTSRRMQPVEMEQLRLSTRSEYQDHMNTMQLAMPVGIWLVGLVIAGKQPSSRKWWERFAAWLGFKLLQVGCFEVVGRK